MSPPLHVTGGVGSVQVDLSALLPVAGRYAQLGAAAGDAGDAAATTAWLLRSHGLPDAGSIALAADLAALAGALHGAAGQAHALSGTLLATVRVYETTEGMLLDPVDHAMVALGRLAIGSLELSIGHRAAAARQVGAAVPELTDSLAWLVAAPLEVWYALLVPDGTAQVRDLGTDTRPGATTPPRGLADLVAQLALRNTGHNGEVSVSVVVGADGRARAIVDIPGTKSWNPWPTHDVTSVGTDARAVAGLPTSYESGVLQALHDASVPPDMPVMLVGHSLGGIIAVNAARTALATKQFDVTHVVTAGSPIGRVVGRLPRSVSVLALENAADVVPSTDGIGNPTTGNVTTVTVDAQHGSIGANHDLGTVYQPEAKAADASDDPSVTAFLDSAGGFLDGTAETTHSYWIRRG